MNRAERRAARSRERKATPGERTYRDSSLEMLAAARVAQLTEQIAEARRRAALTPEKRAELLAFADATGEHADVDTLLRLSDKYGGAP